MIATDPPPDAGPAPVAPRPGVIDGRSRAVAMAALAAASGVVILDASMVNLTLPAMRDALALSGTAVSWIANGYLIAFAGLLLLGGRLADVLGGRRVFLAGLTTYVIASVGCAVAPTGAVVIGARIVQGVGAAVLAPAALALVLTLYPSGHERRRALGIWGGVAAAGSLLGVFLGGAVTQIAGWSAVFWFPVPIGLAVGAAVGLTVAPSATRSGRFDLPGAGAITLGISALALGLISGPDAGWSAPITVTSVAVGAVALVAFVVAERRSAEPLVPLELFAVGRSRHRPVMLANAVMLLLGGVSAGVFYFLPQFQQRVLGLSPLATGLTQLPIAVALTLSSLAAPWLARVLGARWAMAGGLAALLAGLVWLAAADPTAGFAGALLGPFLLIGTGLGLGVVHATTAAVAGAHAGDSGLLSGLINAARQLGAALGLAALVAVATAEGEITYPAAFAGAAALALVALVLTLVPGMHPQRDAREGTTS